MVLQFFQIKPNILYTLNNKFYSNNKLYKKLASYKLLKKKLFIK